MMSILFLILQGGLMGIIAGRVFPGMSFEFFAVLIVNAILVALYGTFRKKE